MTANVTIVAPTKKPGDKCVPHTKLLYNPQIKMHTAVAKPFRILSAYFSTNATIMPPTACVTTKDHT